MAIPRLFVSSTCYDLQEIRFQLRGFINDFGYDAVMSEFDDIFYDYETHVQDSCLNEINKCQLFILIVGNNYGSFYHQDKKDNLPPDSVTLKEFRRALEVKIYKHIFINKYVEYDYKNYKRALDKHTLKYFKQNDVSNDETEKIKSKLKREFDGYYPFPYDSYKYVFYFLDIIHDLKEGNAINSFESFADIKDSLRKQWAGFMYESLTKQDKVPTSELVSIDVKIDRIEKSIHKLFESRNEENGNRLSFDVSDLLRDSNIESLTNLQEKIQELLLNIVNCNYWDEDGEHVRKRVYFNKEFTKESVKKWLNSLKPLVQAYKFSKTIDVITVFKGFNLSKYNQYNAEIEYKTLFEIYSIYNSFNDADKNNFTNEVLQKLNNNYEAPIMPQTAVSLEVPDDDDLPF